MKIRIIILILFSLIISCNSLFCQTVEEYYNKGIEKYNNGEYKSSIIYFDKAIEVKKAIQATGNKNENLMKPFYVDLWCNKGLAYLKLKELEEAIKCFDEIIDKPEIKERKDYAGLCLSEFGIKSTKEAINYLDKAISFNPKNEWLYIKKGFALFYLREFNESLDCLEFALKYFQNNEWLWICKGYYYNNEGMTNEAIKCLDIALSINPNNYFSWFKKGEYLFDIGKYEETIKCLDKALTINPNYWMAWRYKSFSYKELHNKIEADKCMEKANEITNKSNSKNK